MNEFLTIHDLRALLKIGLSTAYRLTRRPGFPDPVQLSGSCYRWPRVEVEAYLDSLSLPPARLRSVPAPGSHIIATRRHGQRRRQGAAK